MAHPLRNASPSAIALTRPTARDLLAGSVAALTTLAGWLTLGLLAFTALGDGGPELGIPAACIAVAAGGLVVALIGRSVTPAAGLSSATVLIFAAALAELHTDPWLPADMPGRTAALLAVLSCAVIGMGVMQMLLGVLRVGSLVRHVPQPVLAGFMNGVALLVLMAQMPLLLGIAAPLWADDSWAALAHAQPATLAVGVATAVVVWVVAARFGGAPAALIGLVVGCALYGAVRVWLPHEPLGALTGTMPRAAAGTERARALASQRRCDRRAVLAPRTRHAHGRAAAGRGGVDGVRAERAVDRSGPQHAP